MAPLVIPNDDFAPCAGAARHSARSESHCSPPRDALCGRLPHAAIGGRKLETRRFELLTSCLQSRRSTN